MNHFKKYNYLKSMCVCVDLHYKLLHLILQVIGT